jgi:hypothetical protein
MLISWIRSLRSRSVPRTALALCLGVMSVGAAVLTIALTSAPASASGVGLGAQLGLPTPPPLPSGLPPVGSRLKKGAEIDVRSCTFAPWEAHSGNDSGQYMVDRNAYYALVFLPTDIPGGHFQFKGAYPHADFFSFESYDEGLASEGVAPDVSIDPNRGSTNPFLPGRHYRKGHASYKLDMYTVAPAQRKNPPPHNVLYIGYRENPLYGNLEHSPYSPVLYRVYAARKAGQGGVPLPSLYWVVDDPATNPLQNQTEVCDAMEPARAPNSAILNLNQVLNERFTQPTLSPLERDFDVPTDDVPTNPPMVNVIRPASNGYQGAYFNSKTPYLYIRPSAIYGRFLVIRFKAPTFAQIGRGRPATGREQTRYWSWCDAQFVSPVNITQACLMDRQFHLTRNRMATLVISPPNQRPVIHGKPYPDWMPWPGGGADLNMREIEPNRKTFSQSPYFIPLTSANDGLDYLRDVPFEAEIKAWMGPYFPDIAYCSTAAFEHNKCFSGAGG